MITISTDASEYLASKHNVPVVVATIALRHAKGHIPTADDHLCNDILKAQYRREAKEYGLG